MPLNEGAIRKGGQNPPIDADAKRPAPPKGSRSSITVSGVRFTADEVVSAVVKKDGREIHITAKQPDTRMGFRQPE